MLVFKASAPAEQVRLRANNVLARLLVWWRFFVVWAFRRQRGQPEPLPALEYKPAPSPEPAQHQLHPPVQPEPATPAPLTVLHLRQNRQPKWVVPKGEQPVSQPRPAAKTKPAAERQPKVKLTLADDPEEWGQYYFRDQILDQLDRYFFYLKRMQAGDRHAYELLRQIGIQLVPYSATRAYDKWRDQDNVELPPWWRMNRPAVGAVAYGFDDLTKEAERIIVMNPADPNDSRFKSLSAKEKRTLDGLAHRPFVISKSSQKYNRKTEDAPSIFWYPRFLYFNKYNTPPPDFESVTGGDVYKMTVYWDRCDGRVPKKFRKSHKGGIPQEYALWVEHDSTRVRVLRSRINERVVIKWAKGPRGGRSDTPTVFTSIHWAVPDRYLRWAHHNKIEPEEYLRRMFVAAAEMYTASSMGSMIRVAVSKLDLTATFGVEIKRTPYFFKDRDLVLNERGVKKRIFHIVRPFVRTDGTAVPMHFRGLRQFTWAGYQVSITVPGRDHFTLPEFDVGMHGGPVRKRDGAMVEAKELGERLVSQIKDGLGARR
jgi:hypothetical protein